MKAPTKKGAPSKAPPFGKKTPDAMPADGEAAPKRADRPARKVGGATRKGC